MNPRPPACKAGRWASEGSPRVVFYTAESAPLRSVFAGQQGLSRPCTSFECQRVHCVIPGPNVATPKRMATLLATPRGRFYPWAVPGAGELAILCAAIMGAGLAFLWFNAPPAAVFMGDTGSLALGGALGAIAVAVNHELVLLIIGGLFVMETASVIIQVFWFKRTGKRIFRMAPIHHHFEQLGWSESKVVIRFWIVSIVLALLGVPALAGVPVGHIENQWTLPLGAPAALPEHGLRTVQAYFDIALRQTERLHRFGVALRRGPHEGRLAAPAVAGVDGRVAQLRAERRDGAVRGAGRPPRRAVRRIGRWARAPAPGAGRRRRPRARVVAVPQALIIRASLTPRD